MPTSSSIPKPVGESVPVHDYYQNTFFKNSEEQDILLTEQLHSESAWARRSRGIVNVKLVAVILFLVMIIATSFAWLGLSVNPEPDEKLMSSKLYTNCGSNYSTAIAAGCVYDIVAPQWTPPECFNADLSKQHASRVSKPMFFSSPNLTEPISEDPLEMSQYDSVWTFDEYHTTHCIYILELAALAAAMASSGHRDVLLNSISSNSRHTKHCTEILSNNVTSPGPVEIRRPGNILRCKTLSPR